MQLLKALTLAQKFNKKLEISKCYTSTWPSWQEGSVLELDLSLQRKKTESPGGGHPHDRGGAGPAAGLETLVAGLPEKELGPLVSCQLALSVGIFVFIVIFMSFLIVVLSSACSHSAREK